MLEKKYFFQNFFLLKKKRKHAVMIFHHGMLVFNEFLEVSRLISEYFPFFVISNNRKKNLTLELSFTLVPFPFFSRRQISVRNLDILIYKVPTEDRTKNDWLVKLLYHEKTSASRFNYFSLGNI